jgi:hypothetical protein
MARIKTVAEFQTGRTFQTTIANNAKPIVPIAAPRASRAAAFFPRVVPSFPIFSFFSFSCFATSVTLAGKIAGKARNSPPTTGPKCLATIPVAAVIAPPNKKRTAYSYQRILRIAEKSKWTRIKVHFKIRNHKPKAPTNHAEKEKTLAAIAPHLFRTSR